MSPTVQTRLCLESITSIYHAHFDAMDLVAFAIRHVAVPFHDQLKLAVAIVSKEPDFKEKVIGSAS